MSSDIFDAQILAEKLSKLNNSQQSIESLSRWCILHRKKARQIVETWDKLFNSSQKEQRVSFLYLANDILQNSRRKGSEFVNEFWKVLPAALKQVYESGEENGKKAVTRLVGIWEERKVFGSRGQGLKDEMLGKNPPLLAGNGKSSNTIKIIKRDANTLRIKLAVGGLPEKILTAFQSVIDEHLNEEAASNKCSAAVSNVAKIREEMEIGSSLGNQQVSTFMDELQAQENVLQQCVEKLESAESTRAMLISQLKEAIQDQESKQGLIHAQLQAARGQIEQVVNLKSRLASQIGSGPSTTTAIPMTETTKVMEPNAPLIQPTSTPPQSHLAQPVVSFAPMKTADEESKKAAAAAVAAKLAASTSSAQMLTSVLSSLVAEEALKSTGFTGSLPLFSPEKRQKLEKSVPLSDSNSNAANVAYFNTLQQQSGTAAPLVPSSSMQSMSQANQLQTSFGALPPLQPPASLATPNQPSNQYVQSNGMMVGVMPYGYGATALPPPPPLPPHIAMGLARPGAQPSQQSQSQQPQQQQQQTPANGGYYRPPGIGFYGQNHQSSTPPVPRQ